MKHYLEYDLINNKQSYIIQSEYDMTQDSNEQFSYVEFDISKLPIFNEEANELLLNSGTIDKDGNIIGDVNLVLKPLIENEKIKALLRELLYINTWFKDNDWKVNKLVIGEWANDDPRWLAYLQERQIKRARQDEINLLLKDNE